MRTRQENLRPHDHIAAQRNSAPVDGHVIDSDTAFSQQFLDVAVGQPIAQIPADSDGDHLPREREASKDLGEPDHVTAPVSAIGDQTTQQGRLDCQESARWTRSGAE
jgi:hypothetical protein